MLEELQRRNLSPLTARIYLRAVEEFARYYKKSPDQLGPEHIRQYQAHLFTERKLGAIAVTQQLSALRFLFLRTLKRPWMLDDMASPKRPIRLPEILSREEAERLIECAASPLHRIWLLTLYATGMRREELVHLKVGDIDSARMLIHIRQGKGRKDREVMLSPRLLDELRDYWRRANGAEGLHGVTRGNSMRGVTTRFHRSCPDCSPGNEGSGHGTAWPRSRSGRPPG
jgi:site-specific recombinase XerD